MKYSFSIIFIITVSFGFAKERLWEEGRLQHHEFIIAKHKSDFTNLNFNFIYYSTREKHHDTIIEKISSKTYILNHELIKPFEGHNSYYTKYQQLFFDLTEYYRREFQNSINIINYIIEAENSYFKHQKNLKISRDSIVKILDKDSSQINRIEKTIDSLLNKPINKISYNYVANPIKLGFMFGLSQSYFAQKSEILKPKNGLYFNGNFSYKRAVLDLAFTMNNYSLLRDYKLDNKSIWLKNELLYSKNLNTSIGLGLLKNKKLQITPLLGYNYTIYKYPPLFKQELFKRNTQNLLLSLNIDFKLINHLRFIPGKILGDKEFTETKIRLNFQAKKYQIDEQLKGTIYQITLLIGEITQFIKTY